MDKKSEEQFKKASESAKKTAEANEKSAKSLSSITKSLDEQRRKEESYARLKKYNLIPQDASPKQTVPQEVPPTETVSKISTNVFPEDFLANLGKILSEDRKVLFDQLIQLENKELDEINKLPKSIATETSSAVDGVQESLPPVEKNITPIENTHSKDFLANLGKILSDDRKVFFDQLIQLENNKLSKIDESIKSISTESTPSRGELVEEEREETQARNEMISSQETFASKISKSFEKITDAIANQKNKVSFIAKILLGFLILGALIRAIINDPEKAKEIALTIINAIWEGVKTISSWIYKGISYVGEAIGNWLETNVFGTIVRGLAYLATSLNILRWTNVINEGSKIGKILVFISKSLNNIFGIFGKLGLLLTGSGLVTGYTNTILFFTDTLPNFFNDVSKITSNITSGIAKIYNKIFGWSKIAVDTGNKIGSLTGRVTSSISSFFTRLVAPVVSFFNKSAGVVSSIASIFPRLSAFFGRIFGFAVKILRFGRFLQSIPVLGQALSLIFTVIDAVRGFIKGFAGPDGSFLKGIRGAFSQIISGLTFGFLSFEVIDEFVTPFFDVLGEYFTAMFDVMVESFKVIWSIVKGGFKVTFAILSLVWDMIKAPFQAMAQFFGEVWDLFQDTEKSIWEKIWGVFKALLMIPVNIVKIVYSGIENLVGVFWDSLKDIGNALAGLGEKLLDYFIVIWDSTKEGLKYAFSAIWDFIKQIPSLIFDGLAFMVVDLPLMIWDYVKKIPMMLYDGLKFMYIDLPLMIWDYIKQIPSLIFDGLEWAFGGIISMTWDYIKQIPSLIFDGLEWAFGGIISMTWDYIKQIPGMLFDGLKFMYIDLPLMIWDYIKGLPSMIWDGVTGWISSWFGGGEEEGVPSGEKGIFEILWDYVMGWIGSIFGGAGEMIGGAISWIGDAWGSVTGAVGDFADGVSNAVGGVYDGIKDGLSSVGDFASGTWDTLTGAVGGAYDGIKDGLSSVGDFASQTWDTITGPIDSLGEGISEGITKVSDWASSSMSKVSDALGGMWDSWFGSDEEEEEPKTSKLDKTSKEPLNKVVDAVDDIRLKDPMDRLASVIESSPNMNLSPTQMQQLYLSFVEQKETAEAEKQKQMIASVSNVNNNNIVNNNYSQGGGSTIRPTAAVDPASSRLRSRHIVT